MARIRLDFFADQSIAWWQTPGGEAALLCTPQPLGPSRGCAGDSRCCRIIHAPSAKPAMRPESRDALLAAIAKARRWIDDIRLGRVATFAEVAELGAQGERHIRLLAPLAFLSPRIIAATKQIGYRFHATLTHLVIKPSHYCLIRTARLLPFVNQRRRRFEELPTAWHGPVVLVFHDEEISPNAA